VTEPESDERIFCRVALWTLMLVGTALFINALPYL
jgi:hypothetical protein